MPDQVDTTNPSSWEKHAREHVAQITRRFPNRAHWVPSARYLAQALDEIDRLREPTPSHLDAICPACGTFGSDHAQDCTESPHG